VQFVDGRPERGPGPPGGQRWAHPRTPFASCRRERRRGELLIRAVGAAVLVIYW